MLRYALQHSPLDTLRERTLAPLLRSRSRRRGLMFKIGCQLGQSLGCVGTSCQHHVLDTLQKLRINRLIYLQHRRIDNAHIHSRLTRVIQEHRVHCLTHRIVATERKREVRHTATNLCVGQILLDPARGLDEIHAIAIVLLDTRSHC